MAIERRNSQIWPTTHWSLVGSAGTGGNEERRQALTLLVKKYLPALRSHLLARQQIRSSEIDDLLQDFLVSKLLEQDIIRLADERRGKFRTFLATALDRFVINRRNHDNAAKRAHHRTQRLDDSGIVVSDAGRTAIEAIDFAWGRQVLGHTIRHMRRECARRRRPDIWTVFRGRVLTPILRDTEKVPFVLLAKNSGIDSAAQAGHLLITANRMFARSLRVVVGAYAKEEKEVDEEIQHLRQILSRPRRER